MKNKFFITLFFLFNIFLLNNVYSQDFNFETNEIEIKDEGNIMYHFLKSISGSEFHNLSE